MALSITGGRRVWLAVAVALAAGLAFRLYLVTAFPYEAGDTPLYEALARNLLAHRVFGLEVEGHLVPVNVRMPGYPAFLAAVHTLFGPGFQPARLLQAVIDTLTALLAGALARSLAVPASRRGVLVAGVWLAALCPFTANYAAAILAETPTAFLGTAALVLLLLGMRRAEGPTRADARALGLLGAAGVVAGIGCYLRPETPLVLIAAAAVLAVRWRRRADWPRLLRTGLALGAGLALAVGPWAVRNAVALGRIELLPPPAANLPGETAPNGFNAWTSTWLTSMRDVYAFSWKVEDEPIEFDRLPRSALDSPEERQTVARLFEEYNRTLTLTPEWDEAFARLARERTARHPLRTWLRVPLGRVPTIWLTPRVELLPWSGRLFPVGEAWEDDPVDFSVTVALVAINLLFLVLAALGAPRAAWGTGAAVLVAWVLLRTALITMLPAPEPRYVVVCFPVLAALAAQLWARRGQPAA
jgi:hypothetical protein